jgi:LysR family hydrogen peroxide-inducible transcriptional activator
LPFEAENVTEAALYREPFYFAVSKEHPKAGRKTVTLADLDHEQVLLLEDGHCLRDQALDVCNSHNAVENTNFRATSIETLRQMVAANVGTTLMPELAVMAKSGPVRYIPFKTPAKGSPPHRDIGLCWRASSHRVALLDEMAALLRRAMR